jgi:hypothetical protein
LSRELHLGGLPTKEWDFWFFELRQLGKNVWKIESIPSAGETFLENCQSKKLLYCSQRSC